MPAIDRYSRNLRLEGFDETSQAALRNATVSIVGAGALGSVVAMYLAGSGVGNIRIADFDNIDISNLQRQVFYTESETGCQKAETLAARIKALNSEANVTVIDNLVRDSSSPLFKECDVIAECSDNPPTKSLVVEAGKETECPVVIGGVDGYIGQIAVFGKDSPAFSEIFPMPEQTTMLPCGGAGVFGPVPGIVACMQASEILKIITGIGKPLLNRLLTFDVRTMDFQSFSF